MNESLPETLYAIIYDVDGAPMFGDLCKSPECALNSINPPFCGDQTILGMATLDRVPGGALPYWNRQRKAARQAALSFQARVSEWAARCFGAALYTNMTERGDRVLEEVLEMLQSKGYDRHRVAALVEYVFGRPGGEPVQEVGGVMVTLAAYCEIAGLDMQAAGDRELDRINQPEVMAKIRAKQEAKNALQFDTPLPGGQPFCENPFFRTADEFERYQDQLCTVVAQITGDEGEDDPLTVLHRYAATLKAQVGCEAIDHG